MNAATGGAFRLYDRVAAANTGSAYRQYASRVAAAATAPAAVTAPVTSTSETTCLLGPAARAVTAPRTVSNVAQRRAALLAAPADPR